MPSDLEPVLAGDLPARNRQKTRDARFRRQQIVMGVIKPTQRQIVSDRKKPALLVVEHREIHFLAELVGLFRQAPHTLGPRIFFFFEATRL
jgi:hypothetical protein